MEKAGNSKEIPELEIIELIPCLMANRDGWSWMWSFLPTSQKVWIIVNEEGTEAAAVTGMTAVGATAVVEEEKLIEFRADHPFAYLIRDRKTGEIIFAGMINQL